MLGAGPERVRLALQLTRFTGDLVLCSNGEPLTHDLAQLLAGYGVQVRSEAVVRFEGGGARLKRIVLERDNPLERDAVFIPTALRQRSQLAGRLGCRLLPDGCVEVDEFARTSVPGVYAAGDMAHRATLATPFAAVSWASASGTLAGAMLDQDLIGADFKLPAPANQSTPAAAIGQDRSQQPTADASGEGRSPFTGRTPHRLLSDWWGLPIIYANVMILQYNQLDLPTTARRTGDAT